MCAMDPNLPILKETLSVSPVRDCQEVSPQKLQDSEGTEQIRSLPLARQF